MLKLNGLGKLAANFSPIGFAAGTRRIHYAWVIVAIAATMGFVTSSVRFAATALVPFLSDSASGFGWSYTARARTISSATPGI